MCCLKWKLEESEAKAAMDTQGEDLLFVQGSWKPSPAPRAQPARGPRCQDRGSRMLGPQGAAGGRGGETACLSTRAGHEQTRTVAAAAEAGVCPVGWRGRVRLTRPQSRVAQPC